MPRNITARAGRLAFRLVVSRDRKERFGALRAALIEGERSRPSKPLDGQPLIRRKRQDQQHAEPAL
jgi:hypothetical protein